MTVQCVVRENAPQNEYQIVLRNTSIYDLAIKIVSNKSKINLERSDALVLSQKYTIINVMGTPSRQEMATTKKDFDIYARAIYPFNRKNIRQWIDNAIPDKEHNRVTSLNFGAADGEYSAKKIIIDLPGTANMIEATGYAIKMKNSRQILRVFMEHDTRFARSIDSTDLQCAQSVKASPATGEKNSSSRKKSRKNREADSCFLLPWIQSVCQPQE